MLDQQHTLTEVGVGRTEVPEGYVVRQVQGTLPWSHVNERLERARNYWVDTVRLMAGHTLHPCGAYG